MNLIYRVERMYDVRLSAEDRAVVERLDEGYHDEIDVFALLLDFATRQADVGNLSTDAYWHPAKLRWMLFEDLSAVTRMTVSYGPKAAVTTVEGINDYRRIDQPKDNRE